MLPNEGSGSASLPRKPVYLSLESARGICAVLVVAYHAQATGLIGGGPFIAHSFLFVDFFFVLSGFVIASNYLDRIDRNKSVISFMKLRFWRIYPLHACVLLVFVLFEIAFAVFGKADRRPFSGTYSVVHLIETIVLLQTFLADGTGWNGPSWSIAVEFLTYLMFGIIVANLKRARAWVFLLISVVAATYLCFLTDRYIFVVLKGAFARCLYGFSVGVLLLLVRNSILPSRTNIAILSMLEIACVILVFSFVYVAGAGPLSMLSPIVFACCVFIISFDSGILSRLFLTKPFLAVGRLSFSIYMVHEFILLRFINLVAFTGSRLPYYHGLVSHADGHWHVTASPLVQLMMFALFAVFVIITANLTYRFVELPFYRRARKRSAL